MLRTAALVSHCVHPLLLRKNYEMCQHFPHWLCHIKSHCFSVTLDETIIVALQLIPNTKTLSQKVCNKSLLELFQKFLIDDYKKLRNCSPDGNFKESISSNRAIFPQFLPNVRTLCSRRLGWLTWFSSLIYESIKWFEC